MAQQGQSLMPLVTPRPFFMHHQQVKVFSYQAKCVLHGLALKHCTDIHSSQMMLPNDFGECMPFHLATVFDTDNQVPTRINCNACSGPFKFHLYSLTELLPWL